MKRSRPVRMRPLESEADTFPERIAVSTILADKYRYRYQDRFKSRLEAIVKMVLTFASPTKPRESTSGKLGRNRRRYAFEPDSCVRLSK